MEPVVIFPEYADSETTKTIENYIVNAFRFQLSMPKLACICGTD